MTLNHRLADAKVQAGSPQSVAAEESFKNPRQIARWNADSAILNAQNNSAVHGPQLQFDCPGRRVNLGSPGLRLRQSTAVRGASNNYSLPTTETSDALIGLDVLRLRCPDRRGTDPLNDRRSKQWPGDAATELEIFDDLTLLNELDEVLVGSLG